MIHFLVYMGKCKEALYTFVEANACVFKGISIFLILLSVSLIVAGSVLVAKYREDDFYFSDSFDDFFEEDTYVYVAQFNLHLL